MTGRPPLDRRTDAAANGNGRTGESGEGHASANGSANGRANGVGESSGRHSRQPAELAVRLQPYPALRVGEPMAITVRLDQLHFFDPKGNRIDVGWR